uniref:Cytochrome b5 heme-binding domain-containing protein n=1 Tax=Eutreptiella gymnastica TaxID=73025 RepID=A0A7S1IH53_9EUGL|mmetsp:Transcript_17743/g.31503  ORF Transcript_17743/g.31503 Transcript_17743/m.31503 type:complete len:298 (+) Transcript_17743:98-991(+)
MEKKQSVVSNKSFNTNKSLGGNNKKSKSRIPGFGSLGFGKGKESKLLKLLWMAVALALLAGIPFYARTRGPKRSAAPDGVRVFSEAELLQFKGKDGSRPILLSIVGKVYDVSEGPQHYGPDGGYAVFAGRDASASFVTGEFKGDGITSDVTDFDQSQLIGLDEWIQFYAAHEVYKPAGLLAERYYDAEGNPTAALNALDAALQEARQKKVSRDDILKRFKSCNSKVVGTDSFFTVWCDAGLFVRELVLQPQTPAGEVERRCVCATAAQFAHDGLGSYPECGERSTTCQRPRQRPGAK